VLLSVDVTKRLDATGVIPSVTKTTKRRGQ
jgi:hypothetical protein